jgi:hypothetical protein
MEIQEFDILLRALLLMSPRQRRAFFKLASAKQMRAFEEACFNLVKNSKLNNKDLKKLGSVYGPTIKVLARRDYSIRAKKAILTQKGGFLATLLPVIASIITSLIAARS